MAREKGKNNQKKRLLIQIIWAALTNGYIQGYMNKTIYKGDLKALCLPGLNCYSCAGALGSCPIGALQAVIGKNGGRIPFYVAGFLMMTGALIGRLVCGFLCPFGLIQDLLHKIPVPLKIRKIPGEKILVRLKYLILLVFVIILPMFFVNDLGNGDPYFCKYICPVGTLEGGIPMVLFNSAMHSIIGFLFTWKLAILIVTVILSVVIYRPFCKFICPLGAVYSLFNKVSLYHYEVDNEKCVGCGRCSEVCFMNVNPVSNPNDSECIRCGKCIQACPVDAITSEFGLKK